MNNCFGCGPENPVGLRLRFELTTATDGSPISTSLLRLDSVYEGGAGRVHGGILATLMDEAMSKLNKPLGVRAVTRHLEVGYLQPTPIDTQLMLTGTHLRREGRKLFHAARLTDERGRELVRAHAVFIVV